MRIKYINYMYVSFAAKVFPGDLVLDQQFQDDMLDKTSVLFSKTAESIQGQVGLIVKR